MAGGKLLGMRRILIEFAWYVSDPMSVEFDIEDIHVLENDDGSEPGSWESVRYAVDIVCWYGLPPTNGNVYVDAEVEHEDLGFGADLRVRLATLTGFSERELEEISQRLKEL